MATEAQRKANRQNAKKSTGPRTEGGKARSSQNGLKHGLLARDAVMADEDPAEFDRQLQELEHTMFPQNALEFELVRQVADAQWRLRRISRIEAGLLTHHCDGTTRDAKRWCPETILPGRDGENQLLGKSMQDRTQALANLARYNSHLSRNLLRAVNLIRQLRADEAHYRENIDPKTGAIHRPSVTDPDPYNQPDPLEPQPTRYEPPAAVAQTPSRPTGFRPNAQSTPSAQVPGTYEPLRPIHESRITTDGPVHPWQGRGDKTNPISPKLPGINGLGCLRTTPAESRITKYESRGLVEPQRHPRRAQTRRRDAPSRDSHPALLMELLLERGAELVDGDLVTLRKGRSVPNATHWHCCGVSPQPWCAGETSRKSRMKESYREGLASHPDPESCGAGRKAGREAETGAQAGRAMELRKRLLSSADAVKVCGRPLL